MAFRIRTLFAPVTCVARLFRRQPKPVQIVDESRSFVRSRVGPNRFDVYEDDTQWENSATFDEQLKYICDYFGTNQLEVITVNRDTDDAGYFKVVYNPPVAEDDGPVQGDNDDVEVELELDEEEVEEEEPVGYKQSPATVPSPNSELQQLNDLIAKLFRAAPYAPQTNPSDPSNVFNPWQRKLTTPPLRSPDIFVPDQVSARMAQEAAARTKPGFLPDVESIPRSVRTKPEPSYNATLAAEHARHTPPGFLEAGEPVKHSYSNAVNTLAKQAAGFLPS